VSIVERPLHFYRENIEQGGAMPDDTPTYWWGDMIRLRIEIQHEINLSDVRAIFRRRGDTSLELSLESRGPDHLRLMEWRREERISEALLEAQINDNTLPGEYDLVAVRGRGVVARASGPTELEFEFPATVCFRIAAPSRVRAPTVTFGEFRSPSP
jgi:hypothetical protein